MILVLNEWMFHDLLYENGHQAFRETAEFVVSLEHSDDVIVIPDEARWKSKAYQLMKADTPAQRLVSQSLHRLLRDSGRSINQTPDERLIVSPDAYSWAPPEDIYLIDAYVSTAAELLVTTDEELFAAITDHGEVICKMRHEFLAEYKRNPPKTPPR